MKLPAAFEEKMRKLMGEEEYGELAAALAGQREFGLRVNTLKISRDKFIEISPFELEAVPWTKDGFYISGEAGPGRHPYYHAGLYYIQEPSAMLPGHVLGAEPGERVLDLCAAPGGKTVQIAAAMKGRGLLVSNDINSERVKALVKNVELCGIRNAVVLNESPEKLVRSFEGYFDRILIDAPCSGEGMFRKDEAAARSWESFKCERCTQMQESILHCADKLLKPGGTLVYSTCTFSPEEDEQMILKFMVSHKGYELAEIPKVAGIEGGRPQWAAPVADAVLGGIGRGIAAEKAVAVTDEMVRTAAGTAVSGILGQLTRTARLWPHRLRGEGHFVAKLVKRGSEVKTGSESDNKNERTVPGGEMAGNVPDDKRTGDTFSDEKVRTVPIDEDVVAYEKLPGAFHKFVDDNLNYFPEGVFMLKGRNLYHLPEVPPQLAGLRTAKFGWFLGTFEGERFEPSHSMVIGLEKNAFKRTVDLDADSREAAGYLKGETLMIEGEKGWTAVCVDGFTIGWAKQTGSMLKNMYPRGWRRLT